MLSNCTVPTVLAEVKVSPVVPSPSRSTPRVVCAYKKSAVLGTAPLVRALLLSRTHLAKVPLVFFQPHQSDCRRTSINIDVGQRQCHQLNSLSTREAGSLPTLLSRPSAKRVAHRYCCIFCHRHCLRKLLFQTLRQHWRGKIHKPYLPPIATYLSIH